MRAVPISPALYAYWLRKRLIKGAEGFGKPSKGLLFCGVCFLLGCFWPIS